MGSDRSTPPATVDAGAAPPSRRRRVAALTVASIALAAAACGSDDGEPSSSDDAITVTDAWSRRPVEGQTTSAVYGVITNGADEAVTMIGASSDVSDMIELHEVSVDDEGMMSMQELDVGVEIPAGGDVVLAPGGLHIMVMGIDPATYPTDVVDLTIEFDDGTSIEVAAEVRSADG